MNRMNRAINLILIFLLVFTPIAFGSVELWAYSIMELGILGMVILWALQIFIDRAHPPLQPKSSILPLLFLGLFLLHILFQMVPLPGGLLRTLSPKAYELRSYLNLGLQTSNFPISLYPFLTRIEFLKWFTLSLFFVFLFYGNGLNLRTFLSLILVILILGIAQSLYGMFEFFSGHRQILYLKGPEAVTGTFINRNAFAGYLLMVIPLAMGYLFARQSMEGGRFPNWRARLSNLDGKSLLLAFGIILMILALLFSSSRMGIGSLLLSFTLITFFFRNPERERRISRTSILILLFALLWAAWIGLDAVISRFLTTPEDMEGRVRIWKDTLSIFKDFPLVGSGLGTFVQIYPLYRSFPIRGLVTHAENDLLQLASEVGLIGMGLIGVLFFYLLIQALSQLRSLRYDDPKRYLGIGGLVGIFALIFHSLVERNLQIPSNAFLFIILWALVLRMGESRREHLIEE